MSSPTGTTARPATRSPPGSNIGDALNARGLSWGWFEGGFRPSVSYSAALAATGHSGQPTSTFTADQFKSAGFQTQVPHSSNQGICDSVHPVGPALGGSGQWGDKNDYIPYHLQYYAATANPHHLTLPTDASGHDTQEINALERTPDWRHTAVIVTYDDSDGWYDHVYGRARNPSLSPADNPTNTDLPGRRRVSAVPIPRPGRRWPTSRADAASARGFRSW